MHGVGLRTTHYGDLLSQPAAFECAEIITENVLGRGGRPRAVLEKVRREVPIFLHGVSMSLGGSDPLHASYLASLKELCRELEPAIVSDHLCFGTVRGQYAHDLWPLPFTEEAVEHVAARARQVQDALGRRLLVENVSSYVAYADSRLTEWEFVAAVAERADCGVLLDVNNVYVSSRNHGFSAREYIDGIPRERVGQYHLAGHLDKGTYVLDNHGSAVQPSVWELYRYTLERVGPRPTIIEWDEAIPSLPELVAESARARRLEEGA